MKKIILNLGGSDYEVHFELLPPTQNHKYVVIESIFSITHNCISIMGFTLEDIENKVVTSLDKAVDL